MEDGTPTSWYSRIGWKSRARRAHVTYVVSTAAFFVSHRLPIALAAKAAGYEVDLVTGQGASLLVEARAEKALEELGIRHTRLGFRSDGMNPFVELASIVRLIAHFLFVRPRVVHCASPKGWLYGGFAARVCGTKALVVAISGMGFAFTTSAEGGWRRKVAAAVTKTLARFVLPHKNLKVIVQNSTDQSLMLRMGRLLPANITLIPGSGVKLSDLVQLPIESKSHVVLLPARMLKDKGVIEFVSAARMLKPEFPTWRFVLAGGADYQNPSAISETQLRNWQQEGVVEWLGHVHDMIPLFAAASVVCLPSYREGMPKCLLEAAAAGCAVVTTDTVGCREAILLGKTGDLVPLHDEQALYRTLRDLIQDKARRELYGCAGRELAIDRFDLDAVTNKTIAIYGELLESQRPSDPPPFTVPIGSRQPGLVVLPRETVSRNDAVQL